MLSTGVGSLPGDDIDAALGLVFDELPDFPHLPELPARGPGADMIGRSSAMLVDLYVDLQPAGWRLVPRPGAEDRRARELLERDLDALVPIAASYDGPFKVQVTGPWTLAAALQTDRGPVLADRGAVRDLVDSLAEGMRVHIDAVLRRMPRASLTVQIDEPSLPAVLAGAVPTASGLSRIAPVDETAAEDFLRRAVTAIEQPVVAHCCAAEVPVRLLRSAGVTAVSLDLDRAAIDHDRLGEAIDTGMHLWAGVVPSLGPGVPPAVREVVAPVRRLWHELGWDAALLPERVTLTPACGLAGASIGWARTAMRLVRQAAHVLAEAPEEARA